MTVTVLAVSVAVCNRRLWAWLIAAEYSSIEKLGLSFKVLVHSCSVGGLKQGLVVELANGSNAMVLEITGSSSHPLKVNTPCLHLLCTF